MMDNASQNLFQGQMDYLSFFQGLAFLLVVAVCCLFRGDRSQYLPWRWFGLFALLQGVAAWVALISLNLGEPPVLKTLWGLLQTGSFFFLAEFGRRGMNRNRRQDAGLWLMALLLMLTALGGLWGWYGIALASRYTLGLIGGIWATVVLFMAGRTLAPRDRVSSQLASVALGLFSLSIAVLPPAGPMFPANVLNQGMVQRLLGVPLEFFQGLMALGMAAGIYTYLPWRGRAADHEMRHRSRYMFALFATLAVILGLGSVLTLYLGEWAHNKHQKIKSEAHEYAAIVVNRLNTEFRRMEDAVKGLAETSWLSMSLRTRQDEDVDRINSLLDRYRASLEAAVCYLMDRSGMTIASSNRNAPDSFVGHNYGFRPYFKQAINGATGRYFAVGVTSKVPGYYVSYPVRVPNGKNTRGVAVIKISLDKISKELEAAAEKGNSVLCLADPLGIVFLASHPDMNFKSLWPVEEQQRDELREQYGKDQFPAIFPKKITDGSKVEFQGRNYMVSYAGTMHTGWSVFSFRPIEPASVYRLAGILVACLLAVLALVSLGSNFFLKESTLASAGWYRSLFNAAPEGVAVIEPETLLIVEVNGALASMLGYTQQELLNATLDEILDQRVEHIHEQLFKVIQSSEVVRQKWRAKKKDGSSLDLDIMGSRLQHQGKEQVLVFGRPMLAASYPPIRIARAEEPVLGGKKDEFENILASLIMQTEMTLDELPPGSESSSNLKDILQSALSAKDLLQKIVSRSESQAAERQKPIIAGEHILLVDDNPQLCKLEEKLLTKMGYQVSAFTDSLAALVNFQENPGKFDLVITDSSMAQLPGLDLAQELLRLRPNIPIILATGSGDQEKLQRAREIGIRECVDKPIMAKDLEKTIRKVLQG